MKAPAGCRLIGRWRIIEADLWDRAHLDLCGPAILTITAQGGEIAFDALEAVLEVEYAGDSIGFRWNGCEEDDQLEGEGTADSSTTARSRSSSPTTTATKPSSKPNAWLLQHPASGVLVVGLFTCVEHGVFVVGALVGGLVGATPISLETFVLRRNAGVFFLRLPFLPYLGLRILLYAGVVLLAIAGTNWLTTPDGPVINMSRADIVFTIAFCVCTVLLFGINDLLGQGVLFAFVAGRYYHPRLEERALLFVDMRSSTAIAESLGEVLFLAFLNRFVTDVSLAILEGGGEIHKYVGDAVISSWKLAAGANEAGCVRACFSALDRLNEAGPAYERDFGFRADFRAGLHCGPVVVGELGFVKKEIALIGDAMNTTQRIQDACREAGCRVLISAAMLDRIVALPTGVTAQALGPMLMRGKGLSVELYALEATTHRIGASDIDLPLCPAVGE